MGLTARYAAMFGGIIGWFIALNMLINRSPVVAALFGLGSVALYGFRRWRTPAAITTSGDRLRVEGGGRPVVVEFYADL